MKLFGFTLIFLVLFSCTEESNNNRNKTPQEIKKQEKKVQKAANRSLALTAIGITFLSILIIATILLLYSIQQLLKNYIQSGKK